MLVWALLCHSCRFACQQRVLKKFPGPGYLHSEDGVVWLWHSLVNLYIYIYIYTFRYSDFYVNLHLPCYVSPSSMEGFFSKKSYLKRFSWGRLLGKIYGEGYLKGLMIRSKGESINCKSINFKSFPQPCWDIHLKIKPWQELWKDLPLS